MQIPQSCWQVSQLSPTSGLHTPLPQKPQSCGHENWLSPKVHWPSPHRGPLQSIGHENWLSPFSQEPLPQKVGGPQSCEHVNWDLAVAAEAVAAELTVERAHELFAWAALAVAAEAGATIGRAAIGRFEGRALAVAAPKPPQSCGQLKISLGSQTQLPQKPPQSCGHVNGLIA